MEVRDPHSHPLAAGGRQLPWLHYADPGVAPICRSCFGSIWAIVNSEAKAAAVLAALEMARRLAEFDLPDRQPLTQPFLLVRYLFLRYALRDQEVVGALYLDGRSRLMGEEEFFRGALSRATVEPRQILGPAIQRSAASVCLFHTHPSGDPSPSIEDLQFTRRMAEACNAVGVHLLDHLILGGTRRWVSLRDRGAF